jgi:OmpA-OmpF porin, OOP family
MAWLPCAAAAENYLGVLKPPKAAVPDGTASFSFTSFAPAPLANAPAADTGYQLKLGYRYSRYFSVEGELNDLARAPADVFATPGSLAPTFRSTGFGVDTVATLPLWRFSFYGRLGAYHGDPHDSFNAYSTSLLADGTGRTRWHYGLGMRYDVTKALGIRAQVERYSALGTPLANEPESDLFSVGVSWRF